MIEKPCNRCQTTMVRAPGGRLYCKLCTEKYRKANADKIKVYLETYRDAHREENILYQRQYRELKGEELLLKKKIKYDLEHPNRKPPSKHGHVSLHPEYVIWLKMKSRCHNPDDESYRYYGGQGVAVCTRWMESFDNFIDDMGPRPEPKDKYSIDRKDNKKGYCKDNCWWATRAEQANNRRPRNTAFLDSAENSPIYYPLGVLTTLRDFSEQTEIPLIICKYRYFRNSDAKWIISDDNDDRDYEYDGKKYSLHELALISGLRYAVMYSRVIGLDWDIERAMFTPPPVSKKNEIGAVSTF